VNVIASVMVSRSGREKIMYYETQSQARQMGYNGAVHYPEILQIHSGGVHCL
jgi:hypothetical protein